MRNIFYLVITIFVFSCRNGEVTPVALLLDSSFYMYPDSSFFSDIRIMQFQNNKLYLGDYSRKDIAVTDDNFSNMYTIGTPGSGPREISTLSSFIVHNDTVYLYDYIAGGIKIYNEARYLSTFSLPKERNTPDYASNFVVFDNTYYLPYTTDSSYLIKIQGEKSVTFGEPHNFGNSIQNHIRNARSVFCLDQRLYAVSDNLPEIQVYDLETLTRISTFDFSNNPLTEKTLQFVNSKPSEPNSYYTIFPYASIFNNYLYLLCSTWLPDYKCNTLIEIELSPKMKITGVCQMSGEYYASFCFSRKYLFAFNSQNSTIERFIFDRK